MEADLGTGLNNNDKVRKSLTDLLKENINLKRELGKKQKEIDRLNEKNNNLNKALERVNKKISTLKNKEEGNNEKELKIADKRDALNFLLKNTIPTTLDYRITSLKNEYSSNFKSLIINVGIQFKKKTYFVIYLPYSYNFFSNNFAFYK